MEMDFLLLTQITAEGLLPQYETTAWCDKRRERESLPTLGCLLNK